MKRVICVLLFLYQPLFAETAATFNVTPVKQATVTSCDTHFDELISFGAPWSDYSRVLIKFNLNKIPAGKFGRVKKAVLILNITDAETPEAKPTILLPMETDWNNNVSWSSPDGGTRSWKSRRSWSNIDYSGNDAMQVPVKISGIGKIEIDITRIVDAWLYQGIPNYGLMIKTGDVIGGKPNAGKWKIEFASSGDKEHAPVLKIEMEKSVKTKVLNWYPSALLPPVRDPYMFVYYQSMPSFPGMVANVAAPVANVKPSSGILPLNWYYGPNNKYMKDEQAFIDGYVGAASSTALGFAVDEWQPFFDDTNSPCYKGNPWAIRGSIKGLIKAEQINPEKFWAVYWRSEESIKPMTDKHYPDLLIIEGYTHMNKGFPANWAVSIPDDLERIDHARKLGMIEKTILMLGMIEKREDYRPDHILTAEEIAEQVKTIHDHAPEMPGIGFYHANDPVLAKAADDACRKVYVTPAPKVKFVNPRFNQKLNTMHIELRVKAECKDNRSIKFYRWFIDNREIARTTVPRLIWDIRKETPGFHMITVHAIDSGWYRAASQIPVIFTHRTK